MKISIDKATVKHQGRCATTAVINASTALLHKG